MDYEKELGQLLETVEMLSLTFTEYSARLRIDELEEELPEDGIEIEFEPEVRLRWVFNPEVSQMMIRAALRVETPIVEICVEARAEYKLFLQGVEPEDLERELLHLFACFVSDKDLHPVIRSSIQDLSLKVLHHSILLPVGSPFGTGHLDKL